MLLPLSQDIQIARAGARSSVDQFALLIKVVVGQVHVPSLRMPCDVTKNVLWRH